MSAWTTMERKGVESAIKDKPGEYRGSGETMPLLRQLKMTLYIDSEYAPKKVSIQEDMLAIAGYFPWLLPPFG